MLLRIKSSKKLRIFVILAAVSLIILVSFLNNLAPYAIFIAIPIFLFYLLRGKLGRSSTSGLFHITYSLELFAAAYALSGSVKKATYYMCRKEYPLSRHFKAALHNIRNGFEPVQSLTMAFKDAPTYCDWIKSLTRGSISDAGELFSIWRERAEEALSKLEDLLSFIIVISTLMPAILSIMLMVFGIKPPLLFIMVILQLLLFQGVYIWLKDLLSLIY